MFCIHCGKKIEESAAFCPECGTQQHVTQSTLSAPVENQTPVENATVVNTPTKKSTMATKVIAIGLIGVTIAGLGASYALFDLMKSPTQVFIEAEQKSMLSFYKSYEKEHQALVDHYVTPYLSAPYKTTSKLSNLSLEVPNLFPSNYGESLKSGALESESYFDPTNGHFYSTMMLSAKDLEKISLSMFCDDKQMGLESKLLGKKAIAIDMSDTDGLYKYFGYQASEIPKASVSSLELFNAVDLKPEELKSIMMNYGQFFGDHLKDADIKLEKGVSLKMSGDEKKVRKLTLTYDQKEFIALMKAVCDKAKEDEQLLDTFYTRYEKVGKILEKSYREPIEFMDKKEFTKEYNDAWESLSDSVSDSELDSFENIIYVTQDDTILKNEMILKENEEAITLTSENWTNGDKNHTSFEVLYEEDSDESHILIANDFTTKDGNQEGTLKCVLESDSDENATFEMDYKQAKKGDTLNSDVNFSLDTKNMSSDDFKVKGSLKGDTIFEEKKQSNTYNVVLSSVSGSEDIDLSFDLDQTTECNKPFEVSKMIGSKDIISLTKASEEELSMLAIELQMSFRDFVSRNEKIFGSNY